MPALHASMPEEGRVASGSGQEEEPVLRVRARIYARNPPLVHHHHCYVCYEE